MFCSPNANNRQEIHEQCGNSRVSSRRNWNPNLLIVYTKTTNCFYKYKCNKKYKYNKNYKYNNLVLLGSAATTTFDAASCINFNIQCDQSSQAKVGRADPRKKFIGKNSKTPEKVDGKAPAIP